MFNGLNQRIKGSRCRAGWVAMIVSGDPCERYERLYDGWRKVEFDIANHAGGGKS